MGTDSLPGVKRPGRGVDYPPPSSAEVKERVELYLYSPYGPSWPVLRWPLPSPLLEIRGYLAVTSGCHFVNTHFISIDNRNQSLFNQYRQYKAAC